MVQGSGRATVLALLVPTEAPTPSMIQVSSPFPFRRSLSAVDSMAESIDESSREPARFRCGLASVLAIALLLVGCDRNVEPYLEGEEPSQPDLARIFPDQAGGAGSIAQGARDSGIPDRTALPPSRAEGSDVAATAQGAAPIEGVIELAIELAAERPAGAVLFVIARPQGSQGGPPLAVLRIPNPDFPLEFSIGPEDVMIPSMQFVGPISLSARLDEDGNAMTRGAGDISSVTAEPLNPGEMGIEIVLSKRGERG